MRGTPCARCSQSRSRPSPAAEARPRPFPQGVPPMIFNDDQLAIQDLARRFAREKLAPGYQARDKSGVLDRALIREMGELGLMGVDLPESFGGLGAPGVTAGVIA